MAPIKENLSAVTARIEKAATKSGRAVGDIAVLAVSKGSSADRVREALEAGLRNFGENKVQEAQEKIPAVTGEIQWQMIGHLQSNKVKEAVSLFHLIQSVDSMRLAENIDREAQALSKVMPVLLEIHISGESQKYGFMPEEIYSVLDKISKLSSVKVLGVMGMAPHPADDQAKRESFKKLKNIFSVCKSLKYDNVKMQYLSMGMSDDFEIAIEEGSNMVRLGRAIFQ